MEAGAGNGAGSGCSNELASVISRVTLSSYHALVRASLRRALERGTWRSYACWACAGVDEKGRLRSEDAVCPALRRDAAQALKALNDAAGRERAAGRASRAELRAAIEGVVLVAPPLFGSEEALREHLSSAHDLPLDYESVKGLTGRLLRRCPKEALPAEPSQQMLDALLGVSGVAGGGRDGCLSIAPLHTLTRVRRVLIVPPITPSPFLRATPPRPQQGLPSPRCAHIFSSGSLCCFTSSQLHRVSPQSHPFFLYTHQASLTFHRHLVFPTLPSRAGLPSPRHTPLPPFLLRSKLGGLIASSPHSPPRRRSAPSPCLNSWPPSDPATRFPSRARGHQWAPRLGRMSAWGGSGQATRGPRAAPLSSRGRRFSRRRRGPRQVLCASPLARS